MATSRERAGRAARWLAIAFAVVLTFAGATACSSTKGTPVKTGDSTTASTVRQSTTTAAPTTAAPTTTAYVAPTTTTAAAPAPSQHPTGTTGLCNDGTYTSAAHSQGACSHHGGLAQYWG